MPVNEVPLFAITADITPNSGYPSAAVLRSFGLICPEEVPTGLQLLQTIRGGESFVCVYRVDSVNSDGLLVTRYLAEKNIVSFGGCEINAKSQFDRLHFLNKIGVPISRLYGLNGASIYSDFITNDQTAQVLEGIRRATDSAIIAPQLEQLTAIAARLDMAGFRPRQDGTFIRELIFDGDGGMFLLVDAGEDLGGPNLEHKSDGFSLQQLLHRYPQHRAYIDANYERFATLDISL